MRGFLAFCVVLVAVILGVGYWRGWFLVDKDRIRDDTNKAVERIKGTGDKTPTESNDR